MKRSSLRTPYKLCRDSYLPTLSLSVSWLNCALLTPESTCSACYTLCSRLKAKLYNA